MHIMQEKKKTEPAKPKPDMVKRVQEASERQRKADEEAKKKKKQGVTTAPSEGVLSRLHKMFMGSSEEKK